jgi:sugar phosphate permease
MLFIVCIFYFVTYLDRVAISVTAPSMMKEFGLSKFEMGVIFSAFVWPYALCQIPSGMLGDRFGPRKVLGVLMIWWSSFTAATGAAVGFVSLVFVQLFFGAGEAGAMANANRAFSRWLPATERGFANGITHSFSRVASAATPPIAVTIMVLWGWRAVFVSFAFIGIAWAVFWYIWYRDTPAEFNERWGSVMNQAEMDLINGGQRQRKAIKAIPLSRLLRSKNLWFLGMSQFMYSYAFWMYLAWLPTYLVEARGFTLIKMGMFAGLPMLAGAIGDTAGGWMSDKLLQMTGSAKLGRRTVPMFGLLMAALLMTPGGVTDSPYLAVGLLTAGLFCLEMAIASYYTVGLDVAQDSAGSAVGMVSCLGNLGGSLSPVAFGIIVQFSNSWVLPFIIASGMLVVGAALWMFVDPGLSLEVELAELDKRRAAAARA